MNHHLRDALQGAKHPSIDFRLTTYQLDLNTSTPVARIAGTVTIAGVQRPVVTTAAVVADTLGRLHVLGSYVVRPTDFGVAPPRRFAGLLRVRDRVAVHFDVALDSGSVAIHDIGSTLIEPINLDFERDTTDASHS